MFKKIMNLCFPIDSVYGDFDNYLDTTIYPPHPRIVPHRFLEIDNIITLYEYTNSPIKELLMRIKLNLEYEIAFHFAAIISTFIEEIYKENNFLLVPTPPDPKRLLRRGFHVPYLMLDYLSKNKDIKNMRLLYKLESTPSQSQLIRSQRLQNLKNKFRVIDDKTYFQDDFRLIILDDVATTGSTLKEVARELKSKYPNNNIDAIVLASDA